jgi:hypothetical protein
MAKAVAKANENGLGVEATGTDEKGHIVQVTNDEAFQKVYGTSDPVQALALFVQCLGVLAKDERSDDHAANDQRYFMPSIVRDIAPRDAIERMLAVQMAATHVAMMRAGKFLRGADQLPQYQAHEVAFNRLARTYAAQMEALRKHRNGGKQTVVVQHVNVEDGGQAIVGNVTRGVVDGQG